MGVPTYTGDLAWGSYWNPDNVQEAETVALEMFDKYVKDARFRDSCTKVHGWAMYIHPNDWWTDAWKRKVRGITMCDFGTFQVNSNVWHKTSFAHELAHIIQRCHPREPNEDQASDQDHSNWVTDGITDAETYFAFGGK